MQSKPLNICVGWDPREDKSYDVCVWSLLKHSSVPLNIIRLDQRQLRQKGLYHRDQTFKEGQMYDTISEAPMATQFALTRFLTKEICKTGWALFMDCDMLVRSDIAKVFDLVYDTSALACVKHSIPEEGLSSTKMDNQLQTFYNRKNWSSFMLINCDHPSNDKLSVADINSLPGRDLHSFCWLEDEEIQELPPGWNYLIGVNEGLPDQDIHNLHYTLGTPEVVKEIPEDGYIPEWYALDQQIETWQRR